MTVIYEPSGRAREYSELACNLYSGCKHACLYCYCPNVLRKSLEEWSTNPQPRKQIVEQLEKEASKAKEEFKSKELLLCFMSDPYQSTESAALTRRALSVFEYHKFKKVNVLTKNPELALQDSDLFLANGWKLGSTVIFVDENMRAEIEPGAPSIASRVEAIKKAHAMGIFTWVSIEPVMSAESAQAVVPVLKGHVDLWKVGKLNHFPEVEADINWRAFLYSMRELLKGETVIWKRDLLKYSE